VYKNEKGKVVTEQQAAHLNTYSKLIYINEILKKEMRYRAAEPWGAIYYLDSREDALSILNQLDSNFKWSFLITEVVNGYKVHKSKGYDKNLNLKSKYYKKVLDTNDNLIATVMFDTQTNEPLEALKIFRFSEGEEITFDFNDNGSIEEINISTMILSNEMSYNSLDSFLADINEFIGDFISQEQLDYFTNVEPIVPNF